MIFNMILGGGAGVALKVSQIAPGSELPEEGELGEVLIETDIELTGRTFFQPTEPAGEFKVGDVWIETKEESPVQVNLADEGSIIMGLKTAYVWDGTKWTASKFYVREEEGWTNTAKAGYLVADGEAQVEFLEDGATFTKMDGYIRMDATSGASGRYRTIETIDLTNYKTLNGRVSNSGDFGAYVAVWLPTNTDTGNDPNAKAKMGSTVSVVSLDISALTGQYSVGIWGDNATSSGGTFDISIYDLWLE